MSIFSSRGLAIDLGTANTIISCNDQIVVDEPSVVAIEVKENKAKAAGIKAHQMIGRGETIIRTVRPLRYGVIANFNECQMMLNELIKKVPKPNPFFRTFARVVIGIPSGATDVEISAVRDCAERIGCRDVYMIYEPMAAALGVGVDVESPKGCMIVDIGGGTTEIAVISLGGIVVNQSIQVTGDAFNQDIAEYMGRVHNLRIDEPAAEEIKKRVGAALTELAEPPEDYMVIGPDKSNSLPRYVPICYQEIAHCLDRSITRIENAIMLALDQTPSELYADIVRNGIYLTGGGALLQGIAERLKNKTTIDFHIADDPLHCVSRGTSIALNNINNFGFLIR